MALLVLCPVSAIRFQAGSASTSFTGQDRRARPADPIFKMIWNLLVDTVFGAIPLVGDLLTAHKANAKNARMLQEHLDKYAAETPNPWTRHGLGSTS